MGSSRLAASPNCTESAAIMPGSGESCSQLPSSFRGVLCGPQGLLSFPAPLGPQGDSSEKASPSPQGWQGRPINQSINSKQTCTVVCVGTLVLFCGCHGTRLSQVIHNLTGLGPDPPEGDDNIFFPVLPRRQGGVFPALYPGPTANPGYSVPIYRAPGSGKPVPRMASNAAGLPARRRLPADSIFLPVTPKALPEETSRVWMWLKLWLCC